MVEDSPAPASTSWNPRVSQRSLSVCDCSSFTDHDSKPPTVSGVLCTSTPTSAPTKRASKWLYEGFGRSVLALPSTGAWLRRTRREASRVHSLLGISGFSALLHAARRCRRCQAVFVEEVPWGDGKRTLTRAYMLFLARWARKLSWKETADAFRTSWEKVFDAVEHAVTFGLEHRVLGQIDAIGVDEI